MDLEVRSVTEKQLRAEIVNQAKSWVGRKESDGTHRVIIDVYNSISPLPRGYRMTYSDPWCATFVSACAQVWGLTKIVFPECGCAPMIDLYKNAGRWMEDDAYVPKPGDVIFYDWEDSGYGDNTGASDHVGLVASVDGNVINIIEGNCGNMVQYTARKINSRYIRGYGLPDYAARATASAPRPKAKCPYAEPSKNIQFGAKGKNVKWLQWHLNQLGEKLSVDGLFGRLTKAAVLRFQRKQRLLPDGIAGPKTRAALKKAVK